jgi:hypothetical protein
MRTHVCDAVELSLEAVRVALAARREALTDFRVDVTGPNAVNIQTAVLWGGAPLFSTAMLPRDALGSAFLPMPDPGGPPKDNGNPCR